MGSNNQLNHKSRKRKIYSHGPLGTVSPRIWTLGLLAADDWTFARQVKGKHQVKYGEAGDCYSSLSCPQGRFSINLQGTAFKVSEATTWAEYGKDPSIRVNRYEVSMRWDRLGPGLPRAAAAGATRARRDVGQGDVSVEMLAMLRRVGARWRASAAATAEAAARSRGSSWTSCLPRRGHSRKRGVGECSVWVARHGAANQRTGVRTRRPTSVLDFPLACGMGKSGTSLTECYPLPVVCCRASRNHARLNALTRVAPAAAAANTRPRPRPARPARLRAPWLTRA